MTTTVAVTTVAPTTVASTTIAAAAAPPVDHADAGSDCAAHDAEIVGRNVLFGLWAGRRLGLGGEALELYAWAVHLADRAAPGHDDMIAKVARDLAARGRALDDRRLRDALHDMRLRARLDLARLDLAGLGLTRCAPAGVAAALAGPCAGHA